MGGKNGNFRFYENTKQNPIFAAFLFYFFVLTKRWVPTRGVPIFFIKGI